MWAPEPGFSEYFTELRDISSNFLNFVKFRVIADISGNFTKPHEIFRKSGSGAHTSKLKYSLGIHCRGDRHGRGRGGRHGNESLGNT